MRSTTDGAPAVCETREPMRVAVNVEQCWHAVPGGTGRVTVDLLRTIVDDEAGVGGDIEMIGVAARHRDEPPTPFRPPIPVAHSRLPRKALYETWHGVRRPRVEGIAGPVDVAVALGGATPPTAGPSVITVHDLGFMHFPDFYTRHGVRFLERGLELARRHATLVQVGSQATFDDCVEHGFEPDQLRIVPWGVDIPDVADDDVAAARHQVGVDGPYVVVVGTLEPRKNLARLFTAWAAVDRGDVTLVVVGPDGWGDAMGDRPADVVFTGFVDRSIRDALYAGAELSVYPSLFEGFGLPVLESMAAGCPVVTSSGTSTEELVVDGGGVAVDPLDTDALARVIDRLLDDDAERARLAVSGRAVADRYSWSRTAREMVACWREVVG